MYNCVYADARTPYNVILCFRIVVPALCTDDTAPKACSKPGLGSCSAVVAAPRPHAGLGAENSPGAGPYLRPARSCTLWRLCEPLKRAPLLLPVQEFPLPLRCWMLQSRPQAASARRRSGLASPGRAVVSRGKACCSRALTKGLHQSCMTGSGGAHVHSC